LIWILIVIFGFPLLFGMRWMVLRIDPAYQLADSSQVSLEVFFVCK
jgi:hypothetical protein